MLNKINIFFDVVGIALICISGALSLRGDYYVSMTLSIIATIIWGIKIYLQAKYEAIEWGNAIIDKSLRYIAASLVLLIVNLYIVVYS